MTQIALCTALAIIGPIANVWAADTESTSSREKRHTFEELKYQSMVRQSLDFSCGAAALATLMTYYYGDTTGEAEILELLNRSMTVEERENRQYAGYSLLDLKRAAEAKGYQAAGYRIDFSQLKRLSAPVIVYVEPDDYRHFAVLRDIVGDKALVADPSRGNMRMDLSRFRNEWQGIAFLIGKPGTTGIDVHALSYSPLRDELLIGIRTYRHLEHPRLNSIPTLRVPDVANP